MTALRSNERALRSTEEARRRVETRLARELFFRSELDLSLRGASEATAGPDEPRHNMNLLRLQAEEEARSLQLQIDKTLKAREAERQRHIDMLVRRTITRLGGAAASWSSTRHPATASSPSSVAVTVGDEGGGCEDNESGSGPLSGVQEELRHAAAVELMLEKKSSGGVVGSVGSVACRSNSAKVLTVMGSISVACGHWEE